MGLSCLSRLLVSPTGPQYRRILRETSCRSSAGMYSRPLRLTLSEPSLVFNSSSKLSRRIC